VEGPLPEEPELNLTLSAGGALAGASVELPNGKGLLVVWDAATGEVIHRAAEKVTAIALAGGRPEGLLAVGDDEGRTRVYGLPQGNLVATRRLDRTRIQCLALSRDRRRPEKGATGWLLAAGDAGGVVALWDGSSAAPRSICRGSYFHVHAVAFSPDGMTLASVGRNDVKLWDIFSGQLLLNVEGDYVLNDVAFAPDGGRLAFSSADIFGKESGKVEVWGLDTGRGVQVLRGHVNRVEKVVFSPDDRLLAALAQDCRVAVWDRERERLLHVFEATSRAGSITRPLLSARTASSWPSPAAARRPAGRCSGTSRVASEPRPGTLRRA
jgi:WD40 repeat protein